ncbi:ATP-binding protein [Acidovorax sp. NCPPB 3859]|nr:MULTISPECIES: ATP-binding protein [unclassified Acidovorax]MDA8448209.1 ATP-binding protein [Acidovorax sp. GBBC 3297]MDA8457824.1 ATP-binding protein [Acidovorax sp. GBBC 3333]MDA8462652.1 ATP-binding protein [Acidovorax sp. GBBC 3332]MDA8467894.1 ATP-binding protein [Acidovorax sp. GBBC 3299]WCM77907.1 ATP-binding protein [Acidovorax sp. GBBC 712]
MEAAREGPAGSGLTGAAAMGEAGSTDPGAERDRLQAELQALRQEQEAFLRAVSHDLRAPLRHILAYGRLVRELVEESNADPEALQFLDTMAHSGQQLGEMIDGLIQLGRAGLAPVQPQAVAVGEALRAAAEAALAAAAGPGASSAWPATVQWQWPDCGGMAVRADAALLHEVLLAVLDNALKFSRPVAQPCIALQAQPLPDGRVEIGVRDNGVGFVPARAQQLFGVFQRLHPLSQFPGLGLGLARAKRFVERMDGEIGIDAVPAPPGGSAEGQGCRLRIVLPAAGA